MVTAVQSCTIWYKPFQLEVEVGLHRALPPRLPLQLLPCVPVSLDSRAGDGCEFIWLIPFQLEVEVEDELELPKQLSLQTTAVLRIPDSFDSEVGEGDRHVPRRGAGGDGLRLPRVHVGPVHGGQI